MTKDCPIHFSMGVLGRNWTMPVMRDVVMGQKLSYSEFNANNPGFEDRMLSRRLKGLVDEGFLRRREGEEVTYHGTEKRHALLPELTAIAEFGMTQCPADDFSDVRARSLNDYDADLQEGRFLPRMPA